MDEKAFAFSFQRQICMELMMRRTLAEGSDGPESSGGVALPPVLRCFVAAITNNETSLRPVQNSGQ
eukprot:497770-Alexandrium_andersonii.AAC.1